MADWVGLTPRSATRVKDACASSGVALHEGIIAIASGLYDIVLVGGIEKMTSLPTERVTDTLATAGVAGVLHTQFQPIVSPAIASLTFTVNGLLMILIGGVGTLSGALVGAAIFRLMTFYLEKWFGGSASFIIGATYIAIVLFLPYGIVGTWQMRRYELRSGWRRLLQPLTHLTGRK